MTSFLLRRPEFISFLLSYFKFEVNKSPNLHKKAKPNLVPSFSLPPVGSVGTDSVSSGSSSGSGSDSGSGSGSSSSRSSKMTSSCRWPVRPSSNEPSRVHEKFGV